MKFKNYSDLIASTGFALAVLLHCRQTTSKVTVTVAAPANANTRQSRDVLYSVIQPLLNLPD